MLQGLYQAGAEEDKRREQLGGTPRTPQGGAGLAWPPRQPWVEASWKLSEFPHVTQSAAPTGQ